MTENAGKHYLCVETAVKYGPECAAIIYQLKAYLKDKNTHFLGNRDWVEFKIICSIFPYFTQDQLFIFLNQLLFHEVLAQFCVKEGTYYSFYDATEIGGE